MPIVDLQRQADCSGYFPADAHTKLCKRTRAQLKLCVNEGGSCKHSTGMRDVPARMWSTFLGRRPGQKNPPFHVRNFTRSLTSI